VSWSSVPAAELMVKRGGSVNPSKFPDETFELLSIPAFDKSEPEILKGSEIGSSKSCVEPGDVLLSKIVPHIRRCWVVPNKGEHRQIGSGEWIIFRDDRFDSRFLLHFLTSDVFHSQFMNTVAGVGGSLVRARPAGVELIEIPLPPLTEQKRIAAILDKADAIRRKRQQAIQLADEFLRAVFLDMFGDPVTNPKGWEVQSIDGLCTEIVDCVNRTAPIVGYPTPYKMIRTTNVRNYALDTSNVRYVDEETYKKWTRRLKPKVGDIIFTREAPAGEAAVVNTDDKIFLGQRTMHFRPDQEKMSPEYLMFELMGGGVKKQINRMHAGSTVTHLSVPECKKFQIRVPPLELQKKFDAIRKVVLRSSALSCEAVEIPLFESISQKALSGAL